MKNLLSTFATSLLSAALLLSASPLAAQVADDEVSAPNYDPSTLRLLRQYSLDLRGQVPTFEEYQRVLSADDPDAEVESLHAEMLEGELFLRTVREYHRSLLWSSFDRSLIDGIINETNRLSRSTDTQIWFQGNSRRMYRNRGDVMCDDVPHTAFDAEGYALPMRTFDASTCEGGTCRVDGYVMVRPYWAPDTEVKVCAFDAQAFPTRRNGTTVCGYARPHVDCGCGPNLDNCLPGDGQPGRVRERVRESLTQEPLRVIEAIVAARGNYLDAFRSPDTRLDGALAHFFRHLTEDDGDNIGNRVMYYLGFDLDTLDSIPWDQEDYVPVTREGGAGVLTTPAYLLRFASNRGRANRFYEAFYCDPFVPSADGIPSSSDEDPHPNLRIVPGCSDCHQTLEPAAAHWARFRNAGEAGLFHIERYDLDTPYSYCATCGPVESGGNGDNCGTYCNTYHVTHENSHALTLESYAGLPLSVAWLEESDMENAVAGPQNLVDDESEQTRVASCAVRTLASNLLHRDMTVDDAAWLAEQTEAFQSDFDWLGLVERMTNDTRYQQTHE